MSFKRLRPRIPSRTMATAPAPGLVTKFEINADMGEGFGRWQMGPDEQLMPLLDAANIACGLHAGDPAIMRRTVRLCKRHRVRAGAHPGLPDLQGFGRRRLDVAPADLYAFVLYQVGALHALLAAEGLPLAHIKPHGALFFAMQRDPAARRAVLAACARFPRVPVYGCASAAAQAAHCAQQGLPYQPELYVDLDYAPPGGGGAAAAAAADADADANGEGAGGRLLPADQSQPATPARCAARAREAMATGCVRARDGAPLDLGLGAQPFSICLHSDMPTVLANAEAVRQAVDEMNRARGWA